MDKKNENLGKDFSQKNENLGKDFSQIQDEIIDILFEETDSVMDVNDILEKIENSKELKNKKILKFSYSSNKINFETIGENNEKETFIFDLNLQSFNKLSENISLEIPKKLEKGNNILQAMDEIFSENQNFLKREINEKSILKTDKFDKNGLKLKGKNLRELQIIFNEIFLDLEKIEPTFNENQKKDFLRQQKKYLEFVAGIGDKYEGGASFLFETNKNFEKISENIINNGSLTEVFLYMAEIHQKIDSNNWQSENVEISYKYIISQLNTLIFERLRKENASDKDFITFSKILTGRGNYKNGKFEKKDIDDNLRDPEMANLVLLEVFQKKGGMFEKMGLKDLDKNLKGKKVADKIEEFKNTILKINPNFKSENALLSQFNLGELSNLKDKKYEELSIREQAKLTVLDKFIKKINLKLKLGKKEKLQSEFIDIFNEIFLDSQKYLTGQIEKVFSGKSIFDKRKKAEDYGLTGIYKEAFDLFVDMNGVGLLNFSDNSVQTSKYLGKMGAVVGASILGTALATILTGGTSLVVQGAVAGGAGSVASWGAFPKGYDSKKEAFTDLSTDLVVGVGTGALGGKLTKFGIDKFGKNTTKIVNGQAKTVKAMSLKTESVLTGLDVGILGFGAEIARNKFIIDKLFPANNKILEGSSLKELYGIKNEEKPVGIGVLKNVSKSL